MYWLEWYFLGAAFCFDVLLTSKIEGMCHSFWKFHCYVHVKVSNLLFGSGLQCKCIWQWLKLWQTSCKKFRLWFSWGWQHQMTKSGGTFGPDILQLSPPFHWVNKVLVGDITGKEHAIGMKNDGFYEIGLWWLLFANALLSSLMCNRLQVLHLWSSFKHTSILVFALHHPDF